jgi:hypothetical protein
MLACPEAQHLPEAEQQLRVLAIDSRAAVAANNLARDAASDRNLDKALELARTAKSRYLTSCMSATRSDLLQEEHGLLAIPQLESSVRKDPAIRAATITWAWPTPAWELDKAKKELCAGAGLQGRVRRRAEARKMLSQIGPS